MKRKNYIDNLRWIWIVTLIPFHSAMAWNTWEGNYIHFQGSKLLSSIVIMISPFYMPLLFVLAGISMKYALQKRSEREFLIERGKKLLLPLLAGIVTVVALMAYLADRFSNHYRGGFLSHYKRFFTTITDFTGYDGAFTPGHLWFMLYLLIVTLVLLAVIQIQRRFLPDITFRSMRLWQILLLSIFPFAFFYLFNFGGKSFGESFALVALGYYVFSEEEIIDQLKRVSTIFLTLTFLASMIYVVVFVWMGDWGSPVCVVCAAISKWCGILGFLGFAPKHLNQRNKFTSFMTARSFAIYLFHFGWVVCLQYSLSKITSSVTLLYLASILGSLILTLLTYEIIRRIPGLRSLYGIKAVKKQSSL